MSLRTPTCPLTHWDDLVSAILLGFDCRHLRTSWTRPPVGNTLNAAHGLEFINGEKESDRLPTFRDAQLLFPLHHRLRGGGGGGLWPRRWSGRRPRRLLQTEASKSRDSPPIRFRANLRRRTLELTRLL